MTNTSDIALVLALTFTVLVLFLLIYFLGRRLVISLLVRRMEGQVKQVEALLRTHREQQYAAMDRLLFQLGEMADAAAIEEVLDSEFERSSGIERERLRKLYGALGITERYIAQLSHSTKWAERTKAAHALGRLGITEAVPALVDVLRDPHEDARSVKLAAAQALGWMQVSEAVPLLIDELETVDEWASPRIADVLVTSGAKAVPMLIEALGDGNRHNSRVWAAQILGRIGDTKAVPSMLRYLRDRHEHVRMSVAEALGHLGDRRAINDLIRVALHDPVSPVRAEAARALGQLGDPAVVESLVELLGDPDYWTRLRAIEAIEAVRPDDVSFLHAALRDVSQEVRRRAAVALERVGVLEERIEALRSDDREKVERALRTLVEMGRAGLLDSIVSYLEHTDFRVRARVAQALGEIGDRRAVQPLTSSIDDPVWPVRARVVESLGRIRPPDGVRLLLPALSDDEESVRTAAIQALQSLGPPPDDEELAQVIDHFDSPNALVRASVVRAVGTLDDPRVDKLLSEAMGDPFSDVRLQATTAIQNRADAGWIEPLSERLTDPSAKVRAAAATALGRIGEPRALQFLAQHLDTPDTEFRDALTGAISMHGMETLLELTESADPSAERLLALTWALGKTDSVEAVARLRPMVDHSDHAVRAAVAGALGKHAREPGAAELLQQLMLDRNERVRAAGVNSMAKTGHPEAIQHLIARFDDPDAFVRNRVALALGQIGGEEAIQGLQLAMDRASDATAKGYVVIAYALQGEEDGLEAALRLLDEPGMQDLVESLLANENDAIRSRFRQTLRLGLGPGSDESTVLSRQKLTEHYVEVLRNHQLPEARAAAVGALQAMGVSDHRELLVDTVRTDPDPMVRRLSVQALATETPDRRTSNLFSAALKDPNVGVQAEAANALAHVADPQFNEPLLICLRAQHRELSQAAVKALAAANRAVVPTFVDELMGYSDLPVLAGGARVLGEIGNPRAVGLLRAWLTSRQADLRSASIAALGRIGTIEAKEAVIESLGDPVEGVRLTAIEALSSLHGSDILDAVAPLVSDPSVPARISLARLLGRLQDPAAAEVAADLCNDPQERVRLEALISLLLLGDVGATRRFVELVREQPPEVRDALRGLQSEHEAVTRTRDLVAQGRRVDARITGLKALSELGQGPTELLLESLKDPTPAVRIAAVEALSDNQEPGVVDALEELLKDPDKSVRDAVRRQRIKLVGDG